MTLPRFARIVTALTVLAACLALAPPAQAQQPRADNPDACRPGFRPSSGPEPDRCEPIPGYVAPAPQPQPPIPEGRFPMPGASLGGIVRERPTMGSPKIASLRHGDPVTILGRAGEMDGYTWFRIEFRGRTGYQWGGIMCSQPLIRGMFQQCRL
jgi:hypothetical protein